MDVQAMKQTMFTSEGIMAEINGVDYIKIKQQKQNKVIKIIESKKTNVEPEFCLTTSLLG